jgi:hypothetical protein
MRKLFLSLFILLSITAASQKLDKEIEQMRKDLAKQQAAFDSSKKINDSIYAANMKRRDSIEMARFNEQNSRNLSSFVKSIQEREQKQKRAMWMRLIFGVALLGVGIYAMLRKRKKKDIQ